MLGYALRQSGLLCLQDHVKVNLQFMAQRLGIESSSRLVNEEFIHQLFWMECF